MMNIEDLAPYLEPLELGAWCYLPEVGSTNDVALTWAAEGALDWSLVLADAQTAGRGRMGRRWVTEPGGALAMSLILRPTEAESGFFSRFTALAALGLAEALTHYGLQAELKWPNDILLDEKKVAGVLVEADWQADRVDSVVIGMGVNVTPGSVPSGMALRYPAVAVEQVLGQPVNRWDLLSAILRAMRRYRHILPTDAFLLAWNTRLAYQGRWVSIHQDDQAAQRMKVVGVQADGRLALQRADGEVVLYATGEILMGDAFT